MMSRVILIIILGIANLNTSAQTFSLITDPINGDETYFHNNGAFDMQMLEDRIVIAGQHLCFSSSGDGSEIFCASLSIFDFNGDLIDGILLDTFFDATPGGLLAVGDRIFTANFRHDDTFLERSLYVQEYDLNLNLVKQTIIPTRTNSIPNNCGIKYINEHFYVYGDIRKVGLGSKGFIQKLDSELNILWDKQYTHGGIINGCNILQETTNEDLIYIHKFEEENTAADYNGLQIVKLNSEGVKLDSLEIEGEGTFGRTLTSDQDGSIYTFTDNHPFDDSIFEQSEGRINKYNSDLDSLIWSLKLPFNHFLNGRIYFTNYSMQARNSDIVACGSVIDNTEDGPLVANNYGFNGFIIRMSTKGEIKWLHLYKSPNLIEELPVEVFGVYHESGLGRMVELEDGRILAVGTSRLTGDQSDIVEGTTEPWSQFLILAVDGASGCIEGEECDEIIVLDKQYDPRDDYLPIVNSSNKWTVEQTNETGFSEQSSYTYFNDTTIFDLLNTHNDRLVTSLNMTSPIVDGQFREVRGRVYKKVDGSFTKEKLLFDISLKEGENITVERLDGTKELVAIITDTIVLLDEIPRKRILLQCPSSTEPQETIVWIEGIGELDNSKECDFEGQRSHILCVQDSVGNLIYNLTGEGCEGISNICAPESFNVGDKWTYDDYFYQDVLFRNYEIVREEEWMGKQSLVVRPGNLDSEDYMFQEGSKVYFWDDSLNEYQLNYDFDNDSLYIIRYYNSIKDAVDSTIVYIDSIRNVEYNGEELQVQYCRSNFGFGGNPFTQKIIKNLGNSTFGPRLPINIIIDDFSGGIGDIRCFESTNCSLQFVDFPCDTTFITSVQPTFDANEINFYPNPVQNKLYLNKRDQNWQYLVYNLQGQLVMQGVYNDFVDVAALPPGIYFLQLQKYNELYQAIKFVKE